MHILFFFLIAGLLNPYSEGNDINREYQELADMAGQLLLVGFRGFELEEGMTIVEDITERNLGGVILFDYDVPRGEAKRNVRSPGQVKELITQLQELAETPLFISVDQEGGRVNRLKMQYGFPPMPSHEDLGQRDSSATYSTSRNTGRLLANLGFNLNFAPVVDVNTNPENPIIGSLGRSFSGDENEVANHAEAFVRGHREANVLTAIKHFPGHGSAWNDTHLGMADVSDTWQDLELYPYKELIRRNYVDMIMTAHIFNEHLDKNHPATLSHNVISGLLRREFGFDGVVISDDMQMNAITEHYGLEEAIVNAINAGVDMLIFANNSVYDEDITRKAVKIIVDNVRNGNIQESMIRESYRRVMALKNNQLQR